MTKPSGSSLPTISELIEVASLAERQSPIAEPVYGPHKPTRVGRAISAVSRATGFYKLLKTPDETGLGGPDHPENREPKSVVEAMFLVP